MESDRRDLVVIGAGPVGLSMAAAARSAGLERVLVLGETADASWNVQIVDDDLNTAGRRAFSASNFPQSLSLDVEVQHESPVSRIEVPQDGILDVHHANGHVRTLRVAIAIPTLRLADASAQAGGDLDNIVHSYPNPPQIDKADDVLVVGASNPAAQVALETTNVAGSVLLALSGDAGSLLATYSEALHDCEDVTVLWNTGISNVEELDGSALVQFNRETPDLVFDHVIYAPEADPIGVPEALGIEVDGPTDDLPAGIFVVTAQDRIETWPAVWAEPVSSESQNNEKPESPSNDIQRSLSNEELEQLRDENYNATIESIHEIHSHLWILQVASDDPVPVYKAGQYATLGLGYWEPRIDRLPDHVTAAQRSKVVKRSYSISDPVLDEGGDLFERGPDTPLEIYVALVAGVGLQRLPMLTPRLFAKSSGDRIFLGRRIVGRYVLDDVGVDDDVLLLGTGTGEAPHNTMINSLLRSGHRGQIVSLVSVRYQIDLGYHDVHRELERRFPNYRYIPIPTREAHSLGNKTYIQDLLREPRYERDLGISIDPDSTHVFLCGNPAMIGLPSWDGDEPNFPNREGACEVLHKRGFTLDRRGQPGNVHFEEYW